MWQIRRVFADSMDDTELEQCLADGWEPFTVCEREREVCEGGIPVGVTFEAVVYLRRLNVVRELISLG